MILELSKEEYKGYPLKFKYTTDSYYKVDILEDNGFTVTLKKECLDNEIDKSFTDTLFPDYWQNASAYGYFVEGKIKGILEVERELWSKRLRVTSILVDPDIRRNGIGALLLNKAREIALEEGYRAIILETQTCNVKAIEFYLSQGFKLGGFDRSCYSNNDIEKKEVRLELVFFTN
ncbi:GNAT family N-acetyltransferase [Mycoplasmatota bacterium WC44]